MVAADFALLSLAALSSLVAVGSARDPWLGRFGRRQIFAPLSIPAASSGTQTLSSNPGTPPTLPKGPPAGPPPLQITTATSSSSSSSTSSSSTSSEAAVIPPVIPPVGPPVLEVVTSSTSSSASSTALSSVVISEIALDEPGAISLSTPVDSSEDSLSTSSSSASIVKPAGPPPLQLPTSSSTTSTSTESSTSTSASIVKPAGPPALQLPTSTSTSSTSTESSTSTSASIVKPAGPPVLQLPTTSDTTSTSSTTESSSSSSASVVKPAGPPGLQLPTTSDTTSTSSTSTVSSTSTSPPAGPPGGPPALHLGSSSAVSSSPPFGNSSVPANSTASATDTNGADTDLPTLTLTQLTQNTLSSNADAGGSASSTSKFLPGLPPPLTKTGSSSANVVTAIDLGMDPTTTTAPLTPSNTFTSLLLNSTATWGKNTSAIDTFASTFPSSDTWTTSSMPPTSSSDDSDYATATTATYCQNSDYAKPHTVYSIVYTSTITWFGNPDAYTAPYPTTPTPATCITSETPVQFTLSLCTSTATGTKYMTCDTTNLVLNYPYTLATPITIGWGTISTVVNGETTTVLITSKNPAVVYSTITTPSYGVTTTPDPVQHQTGTSDGPITTPEYGSSSNNPTLASDKVAALSPVTVAVYSSSVVINGQTVVDDPNQATQVVTIDGGLFTVDPSQVIGASATVNRPALVGGVYVPTPTSTNIDGINVVVSSSVAVIDGTSFTIGFTPTTAVVAGQTVVVGPSGIDVASQTIPVTVVPEPTEVVIAGGEIITAIGQSVVVIDGTSLTYGPSSSSLTVIDGDTITIGPMGVTVHGTTLGGLNVQTTDTEYDIVGGATLTEIGASIVVIQGTSYTVGPGAGTTTTVIGGETITLGPSGVSIETLSFPYPFGPTTTITPGTTPTVEAASPTSKDAGFSLGPDRAILFITCIAIGVLALV